MKLLYDHNLPPSLVKRLSDLFPFSEHVCALGLDRAADSEIRDYAQREAFVVVTKDADFLLREHHEQIDALEADAVVGVLTLFLK
jgi:predicted nuclease of predicted toxin-antitoxin system